MKKLKTSERLIALIVAIVILASPLVAQQRRIPAPRKPAATQVPEPTPTFDSLLSTESYRVYCEVRGVGQLIRSPALNDLLDPVVKLVGPPKEFKAVLKWLNAHAETLAGSRMLVVSWPARTKLPNVLMAIEFSSAEEARKFEPELRGFIPTLTSTPTPTPVSSPAPGVTHAATSNASAPEGNSAIPPYQIKQSGSLVLLSDQPFAFRDLTPKGSKLLAEDQNFAMARNRFASESVFIYVDVKSIEKEERERAQKYEAEQQRIEREAANRPHELESPGQANAQTTPEPPLEPPVEEPPPQPAPAPSASPQATLRATASGPQDSTSVTLSSSPNESSAGRDPMGAAMTAFYSGLFGGQPKWPEAVGAAIAFEGDAYVVRTLIVNANENKNNAIPFFPQFISGPALIPESPNILPADTDLFLTASLDYPQMYEAILKAIANAEELSRKYRREPARDSQTESPFAVYEKKLGLKIKDDLLPLFGNEIAFALSRKPSSASQSHTNAEQPGTENVGQKNVRPADPSPVIVISVKDKEAVRQLIPRIFESLGFKGADLFAQTEKRDETEIISYANILSYAFVGDFLVLSPDATAMRHVVDSYLAHETLSSDIHFRNSTGWQPRQVLGQVYVSPGLMGRYNPFSSGANAATNEKMLDLLSRFSPVEPLTYALSNDGLGPLHELHLPKNLLLLMVAGISSRASEAPVAANEAVAKSLMRTVVSAEATFQATEGNGRYGTLEELLSAGLISKEPLQKYGYKIEVAVSGNRFEVTAVPLEYGKTGRQSYFIDESGVLRGGDHGGGAATISDKPAE